MAEQGGKFKTQKSFKSDKRDKPKHSKASLFNRGQPKKGGGGGAFTWGRPGDELRGAEDAQYELDDFDASPSPISMDQKVTAPKNPTSVADLNKFKAGVREAARDFMATFEVEPFIDAIKDLATPIYHQEIPRILISMGLDQSEEKRGKISHLLHRLFSQNILTSHHLTDGFKNLYYHIEGLLLDSPKARELIGEFVSHASDNDMLDKEVLVAVQAADRFMSDASAVAQTKTALKRLAQEYLTKQDVDKAVEQLTELKVSPMHFYLVKELVSCSLDRSNRERELASIFIGRNGNGTLKQEDIERGFTRLLSGLEDLALDVPDAPQIMACFLARAVADEALPPAFLVRVNLADSDAGARALAEAQRLLRCDQPALRMQQVWEELSHFSKADDALAELAPHLTLSAASESAAGMALRAFFAEIKADYTLKAVEAKEGVALSDAQGRGVEGFTEALRFAADRALAADHWYFPEDPDLRAEVDALLDAADDLVTSEGAARYQILGQMEESLSSSSSSSSPASSSATPSSAAAAAGGAYILGAQESIADFAWWAAVSEIKLSDFSAMPKLGAWFYTFSTRPSLLALTH